jgi:hypothetical protein
MYASFSPSLYTVDHLRWQMQLCWHVKIKDVTLYAPIRFQYSQFGNFCDVLCTNQNWAHEKYKKRFFLFSPPHSISSPKKYEKKALCFICASYPATFSLLFSPWFCPLNIDYDCFLCEVSLLLHVALFKLISSYW